ncbi:MAG: hypothetical protein V2A53_06590 [bacterium]
MLVLIERRGKYKCAKCFALFNQADIDNRDFREWNKEQRYQDIIKWELNSAARRKRIVKKPNLNQRQETLTKYINATLRKDPGGLKEYNRARNKVHYYHDLEHSRVLRQIRYWRQELKKQAIERDLFSIEGATSSL